MHEGNYPPTPLDVNLFLILINLSNNCLLLGDNDHDIIDVYKKLSFFLTFLVHIETYFTNSALGSNKSNNFSAYAF